MIDHRDLVIEDLAAENASLRDTNDVLLDIITDLVYQNFLLSLVADYRCRHNPDLLDTLTQAAKASMRAAA